MEARNRSRLRLLTKQLSLLLYACTANWTCAAQKQPAMCVGLFAFSVSTISRRRAPRMMLICRHLVEGRTTYEWLSGQGVCSSSGVPAFPGRRSGGDRGFGVTAGLPALMATGVLVIPSKQARDTLCSETEWPVTYKTGTRQEKSNNNGTLPAAASGEARKAAPGVYRGLFRGGS